MLDKLLKLFNSSLVYYVVAVVVVVVLGAVYIFSPIVHGKLYTIEGTSMYPTLNNGDKVYLDKESSPSDGDVVAILYPSNWIHNGITLPRIKRLYGSPGDVVSYDPKTKEIKIKERTVKVPWCERKERVETRIDGYFVMGDNAHEGASADSRSRLCVDEDFIVPKETEIVKIGGAKQCLLLFCKEKVLK